MPGVLVKKVSFNMLEIKSDSPDFQPISDFAPGDVVEDVGGDFHLVVTTRSGASLGGDLIYAVDLQTFDYVTNESYLVRRVKSATLSIVR